MGASDAPIAGFLKALGHERVSLTVDPNDGESNENLYWKMKWKLGLYRGLIGIRAPQN